MTARFVRIPFQDRHAEPQDSRGCIIKDRTTGRAFSVLGDVEQQALVCNALNRSDEAARVANKARKPERRAYKLSRLS